LFRTLKNVFNREVHDAEVANNLLDKLGIVLPVEQGQHSLEPGSFERLISYAWVVYLRASKCGGAQGPAHEWVHDAEVANNLLDKLGIVLPVEQGQHNIHIRQRERRVSVAS
jgi:hypothetical protein